MSITEMALTERGAGPACGADKLKTNAFPPYATTLRVSAAIGDTSASVAYEAERDTLFLGLSVRQIGNTSPARLTAKYCRTLIMEDVTTDQFPPCCDRKPVFLQGVNDTKKLEFTIDFGAPLADPAEVLITLYGIQGNGCC